MPFLYVYVICVCVYMCEYIHMCYYRHAQVRGHLPVLTFHLAEAGFLLFLLLYRFFQL